jgi:hypothetical protein
MKLCELKDADTFYWDLCEFEQKLNHIIYLENVMLNQLWRIIENDSLFVSLSRMRWVK